MQTFQKTHKKREKKREKVHSSRAKCVSASVNVRSKCCRRNLCFVRLSYCVRSIVLWCLHQASLEIYSWCTAAHSFRHAGLEKHECENTRCKLLNESNNAKERARNGAHAVARKGKFLLPPLKCGRHFPGLTGFLLNAPFNLLWNIWAAYLQYMSSSYSLQL